MSENEIILSQRISMKEVLAGTVDTVLRIGDKNKWTVGSTFDLMESFVSKTAIKIKITSSEAMPVTEVPLSVIKRAGYDNEEKFRSQWEYWFQNWDHESKVWIVTFELIKEAPVYKDAEINEEDLFA
jgi:hypothetical protein